MIKVYTPGCWDLLHIGHVNFLNRASHLGNHLTVGVASDRVILQDKGRLPVIALRDRIHMLVALRCVNSVASYDTLDFLPHLEEVRPHILVVGEDWKSERRHRDAEEWCRANDAVLVKIPRYHGESTSQIVSRIKA